MENPKYEQENGEQQIPAVNNGNLPFNYDTVNHNIVCKYNNIIFNQIYIISLELYKVL